MTVDVVPPPPTIDVTVNRTGTFNSRTGEATISGKAKCTPVDGGEAFAGLEFQLSQKVGRFLIRGWGYDDLACDGQERPWTAVVVGDNGLFKGGKAANVTVAYACGDISCSDTFVETTIQLKGGKR